MRKLSREKFIEEINSKKETLYNVSSVDVGTVYLSLGGCVVTVDLDSGIDGEITFFKPYTAMEVSVDFAIVESLSKDGDTFTLEFNNGMTDVEMTILNE